MTQFHRTLLRVCAATLSGCLLALASSLHPLWPAAWIASAPVLVAAFASGSRGAFLLGLVAGLVGAASLGSYLATLAPWLVVLTVVVLKALLYAGGVRFAWAMRRRLPIVISVWAFPAWFAAVDVLISTFSADGTAGSLAYSQMDVPAVLQIAALGGAPAIVFVLCLFSSALAHALSAPDARRQAWLAVAPALGVVGIALGFGAERIGAAPTEPEITVALAALDPDDVLPTDWRKSLDAYRPLLAQARTRQVRLVVLPEEIAIAATGDLPSLEAELGGIARDARMSIAVGFRIVDASRLRNVLLFATPDAEVRSYDKQHLVPGFEIPKITPGARPPLIVEVGALRFGGAVCKDLDFVDVGRSLGERGAHIVAVPAWDFGKDAWLHGRMAMLRAVEGGFTLVRSAREGTMSVSDRFGRVLAEAPSGPRAPLLVVQAPVPAAAQTTYARVGEAFGWACVALLLCLLVAAGLRRGGRAPTSDTVRRA